MKVASSGLPRFSWSKTVSSNAAEGHLPLRAGRSPGWKHWICSLCLPDDLNISEGGRHAKSPEGRSWPSTVTLVPFRSVCFCASIPFALVKPSLKRYTGDSFGLAKNLKKFFELLEKTRVVPQCRAGRRLQVAVSQTLTRALFWQLQKAHPPIFRSNQSRTMVKRAGLMTCMSLAPW
jgi:hypothetical protein